MVFPAVGAAEPKTCAATTVSVEAVSEMLVQQVCETVRHTRLMLGACHLSLPRNILVVVSDELSGPSQRCIGIYERAQSRISVLSPKGLHSVVDPLSAFADIEEQIFFESVLVHELTHAAFEYTASGLASCANNHEYVAYAMQMLSLPAHERQKIVATYDIASPIDPLLLNSFIAAMAPDRFAAIVWQHYSERGNGCSFIRELVSGESTLGLAPQ